MFRVQQQPRRRFGQPLMSERLNTILTHSLLPSQPKYKTADLSQMVYEDGAWRLSVNVAALQELVDVVQYEPQILARDARIEANTRIFQHNADTLKAHFDYYETKRPETSLYFPWSTKEWPSQLLAPQFATGICSVNTFALLARPDYQKQLAILCDYFGVDSFDQLRHIMVGQREKR